LTITEASKGKSDVFFKIGTMTKKIQSSLAKATIVVCGKETVTYTSAGPVEKVLRSDAANEVLLTSTLEAWFAWVAGPESSAECFSRPAL
jgi:hypothetical protein